MRRDGLITAPLTYSTDKTTYAFYFDWIHANSYREDGRLEKEGESPEDLVALLDSSTPRWLIDGMNQPQSYDIDEKSGQVTAVALKHDSGKIPYDLIPLDLLDGTARVFGHGLKKYGRNNYRLGFEPTRPLGAILRHLAEVQKAIETGDNTHMIDSETGEAHLHHAVCSLLILIDSLRKKGEKV
jgi:hypothetical protein